MRVHVHVHTEGWIKTGYVCVYTHMQDMQRLDILPATFTHIQCHEVVFKMLRNSYIIPFNFFHLFSLSLSYTGHVGEIKWAGS